MNKILSEFSESKLKIIFRNLVFKNGRVKCSHCGCFKIRSLKSENRYHCARCRKKFSILSGTWMKNVKIPLSLFIILLSFWLEDVPIGLAQKLTRTSIPTIRHYYRLFRLHIVKTIDFKPENSVQVDEAYFGRFKKQANYFHGFRTYRVAEKTCVAGISCPSTGQLAAAVPSFYKKVR